MQFGYRYGIIYSTRLNNKIPKRFILKKRGCMKKIVNLLLELMLVILGNTLCAFGVVCFVEPGGLIMGGTTGIALFLQETAAIPVSLSALAVNGVLFIIGVFFLGKKFAVATVLSTFYYPAALEWIGRLFGNHPFTADPMLCAIFGGLCVGIAIGLVFRTGASTGGMDIPPLILHRLFGWSVSVLVYIFDILILLLQLGQCSSEQLLYSLLLVIIYTVAMDKVLMLGTGQIEIKIVSSCSEEIRRKILEDADRGVSLLQGKTGYLEQDMELLFTVVSARELRSIERMVHEVDSSAFIIITSVREVKGKGFTLDKEYVKKQGR